MAELPAAASRNLRQAYSPEVVHSLDHHTTSDPHANFIIRNQENKQCILSGRRHKAGRAAPGLSCVARFESPACVSAGLAALLPLGLTNTLTINSHSKPQYPSSSHPHLSSANLNAHQDLTLKTLVPANHCYTTHISDCRAPRVKRYTLSARKTATQAICATLSGTKVCIVKQTNFIMHTGATAIRKINPIGGQSRRNR